MQEKITVVNDRAIRYAVSGSEILIDIKPLLPTMLAKKMTAIKDAAHSVDPAYGSAGRIWHIIHAVPDVIDQMPDWDDILNGVIEAANLDGKMSPRQIAAMNEAVATEKVARQTQNENDLAELRKIADALRKDLADQQAARQLELEQIEAKRLSDLQTAELAKAAEQTAIFEQMKTALAAQTAELAKFRDDEQARKKITANWVLLWFRNPAFAVFGSIAVAVVMGLLGYKSVQAMFPDFPTIVNIGLATIIAIMQLLFASRNYHFWDVKATWWLAAFDVILLGLHMEWAPVMLVKAAFTAFIPFIIAALSDLNSETIVVYEERGII